MLANDSSQLAKDVSLKQRHRVDRRTGAADNPEGVDGQHELVAALFGACFGRGLEQRVVQGVLGLPYSAGRALAVMSDLPVVAGARRYDGAGEHGSGGGPGWLAWVHRAFR